MVGRLARRGHIPLGYYKDPEKTAATFPVVDGVRWAVPGDHAVVEADGTITLLGRGSVSINTGGEKVYPEEVEAALKAHADVFDAVVVGVPDERWGERVVAVVQPRPGAHADARRRCRTHAREHLAGYKVPRDVVFVDAIDALAVGQARLPLGQGDAPSHARRLRVDGDDRTASPTRPARTSASTPTTRSTGTRGATRRSQRRASEDKPIFLSVGYSSCHWCHVMAHESFEDPRPPR